MDETDSAPSWSLSVTGNPRPFELFVRDALRLDTTAEETSPPPLVPYPADHSSILTSLERQRVEELWPEWWRAHVAADPLNDTDRAVGLEIERVASLLEPLSHEWARREPPHELDTTALTALDCGAIATDVAARRGVALARVRGRILVYGVEGPWRRLAAPGVLLCSALDLQTQPAAVVHDVLESSVDDPT